MRAAARIEVCGGIASGKTTFVRLFKGSEVRPVFETFRANPFWRKFLSAPLQCSFETEVAFLLQHCNQIREPCGRGRSLVCDFSIFLDLAYARAALRGSTLKTFDAVWAEVVSNLGPPAFLVYLQCDARTELNRIRARARAPESSLTIRYLRRLNSAIHSETTMIGSETDIIKIDSASCDFANDRKTKRLLREHIFKLIAARER
jgi:deoxyadenosine/deoxycytidine kinase